MSAASAATPVQPASGDNFGEELLRIVEAPGFKARLEAVDQVIQVETIDPAAVYTLFLRRGEKPRLEVGDNNVNPDLLLTMPGEQASQLLLGQLNLPQAFGSGSVRYSGNPLPLLRLLTLIPDAVAPSYRRRVYGLPEAAPVPPELRGSLEPHK